MNQNSVDQRILELARQQYGLVGRGQLVDMGIDHWLVDHRIRSLRLVSMIHGVYAVGHDRQGKRARLMAALLFAGQGAVLSHHTAAALWGLMDWHGAVHVMRDFNRVLPGRQRDSWLVVHRTRRLPADEVRLHVGFPVTSVERTLLDLAGQLDLRKLESCLVAAERLRLIDLTKLNRILARGRGWKGIGTLRRLVAEWDSEITRTRTELEEDFFALCRERGLDHPQVNVLVEGFEVDHFWPQHRLVVELDSRQFHLNRKAFEIDRIRDAALQAAGYRVARITYRRIDKDPEAAVDSVLALIR